MIHISEISTEAPAEKRGALENKVYETLQKLGIAFERVDNDAVDAMEDCVEIGEKLGAEIRKSILLCNRKKTSFYLAAVSYTHLLDGIHDEFAARISAGISPADWENLGRRCV